MRVLASHCYHVDRAVTIPAKVCIRVNSVECMPVNLQGALQTWIDCKRRQSRMLLLVESNKLWLLKVSCMLVLGQQPLRNAIASVCPAGAVCCPHYQHHHCLGCCGLSGCGAAELGSNSFQLLFNGSSSLHACYKDCCNHYCHSRTAPSTRNRHLGGASCSVPSCHHARQAVRHLLCHVQGAKLTMCCEADSNVSAL